MLQDVTLGTPAPERFRNAIIRDLSWEGGDLTMWHLFLTPSNAYY